MRGRGLVVVAAGAIAAFLAGPAAADTPPPLSFEMSSGTSSLACTATQPATVVKSGQTCKIVQPAGGTAWCIEWRSARGPDPVGQVCKIRQASTWRDNVAYVVQVLEMKGGPSPQDASQVADVRQGNRNRHNKAYVTQVTKLALGSLLESDGSYWGTSTLVGSKQQVQEAHQSTLVCQGAAGALGPTDPSNCRGDVGMLGSNLSNVHQWQWESEQAAASETITQKQNTEVRIDGCRATDPADPTTPATDTNMCANVDQRTQALGGGANTSDLDQLSVELQNAKKAATVIQRQGGPTVDTGGLDHTINQLGPKPSSIETDQHSFQIQRVEDAVTLIRKQDPKLSKGFGSSQGTNPADVWTGRQSETQLQFEDGVLAGDTQTSLLEYFGDTSGHIEAKQRITQNEETQTNSCSGTSCAAVLECTTVPDEEDYLSSLYWPPPPTQVCTTSEID
jgi:hypothetical protein